MGIESPRPDDLETESPVVDLRVFPDRGYAAAAALNVLVGTAIFAGSVLLSLSCGTIVHDRTIDIGRVCLQGAWIQILIFPIVGKLVTNVDSCLLMVIANVGIVSSLWIRRHLTATADMLAVVLPYFVRCVGTGFAFGFVPLTYLAVASLPAARHPSGTALFNLTRELGASIGTATISTMIDRESKQRFTSITSRVDARSALLAEQAGDLARGPGCLTWMAAAFLVASVLIVFMRKPNAAVAVPKGEH